MRLLIAINPGKRDYLAWLTKVSGSDQALVARLKYHASHLGWHVHLKPKRLASLAWGVVKQQNERLIDCASDKDPALGKGEAEAVAFEIFNVSQPDWGLS